MTGEVTNDPAVSPPANVEVNTHPGILHPPQKFTYEVVQGFFRQNDPLNPPLPFEPDLLELNFGFIDTSPARWANLDRAKIDYKHTPRKSARHGQGVHNAAATTVGAKAWEEYWAMQNGNGQFTWGPDPVLTEEGLRQAREVYKAWKREKLAGAPLNPERTKWWDSRLNQYQLSRYVSPLSRTGQTLQESFGDLLTGEPEVWEDWREVYGCHTCDIRPSKTEIANRFPSFKIEEGFAEEDPYWKPDYRETDREMQVRARRSFDRIFSRVGASQTYISITSHGGILRNALDVLGHYPRLLKTGEMIPVVVRAMPTSETDSET